MYESIYKIHSARATVLGFYCLLRCNNTGCMRITTLCMGMAVGHFYNGALLA